MQPFLTIEQAYARVHREDVRQAVMMLGTDSIHAAATPIGVKTEPQRMPMLQVTRITFSARGGKKNIPSRVRSQSSSGCTHYGNSKHTHKTGFKLHGYLGWWKELKAQKQAEVGESSGKGKASLANAEPHLCLVSQVKSPSEGNHGFALLSSNQDECSGWIIY